MYMNGEIHLGRHIIGAGDRVDIIGPCAAQSREQVMESAQAVRNFGHVAFRACVFKPRTSPSPFEGVGESGYHWLAEASGLGLVVSTELRDGDSVRRLAESVFDINPSANILVWVGSRNTDHVNVRSIGQAAAEDPRISVGHKNPMHYKDHHTDWIGLVEHLRSGGLVDERVVLVHRGFAVNRFMPNPHGMKNVVDHDVAMRVSEQTGLPILLDLSHPAGRAELVNVVAEGAREYPYRGFMIEAAPEHRIAEAITDRPQHVTIEVAHHIVLADIQYRRRVHLAA
jgi:3-deoxy-D-arabino-heptulosonate 7-phosphate (DAHP) synthase